MINWKRITGVAVLEVCDTTAHYNRQGFFDSTIGSHPANQNLVLYIERNTLAELGTSSQAGTFGHFVVNVPDTTNKFTFSGNKFFSGNTGTNDVYAIYNAGSTTGIRLDSATSNISNKNLWSVGSVNYLTPQIPFIGNLKLNEPNYIQ
jgi:hypothetical protein